MRSKEVADLAGVTVRALRHYHALGLLPEPPRSENGYRDYGAMDVARVLRIKRMAGLGLSLEAVKSMLDVRARDGSDASDDALAALEDELSAEIARLDERRRAVRALRAQAGASDAPAGFEGHVARLVEMGASRMMVESERDLLLLADGALADGADEMAVVRRFFDFIRRSGLLGRYIEVNDRVFSLPESASEDERSALAHEAADFFLPIVEGFFAQEGVRDVRGNLAYGGDTGESPRLAQAACLIDAYDGETLNAAQRDVSVRIEDEICRRMGISPR